jgi:hypothetical protein
MKFSDFVPNPFLADSNLVDLNKKIQLSGGIFGLIQLGKKACMVPILGVIASLFLSIPIIPIIVLVIFEELSIAVSVVLFIFRNKEIYGLDTKNQGKAYKQLLCICEYYGLLGAVKGVIATLVAVVLIILFFSDTLTAVLAPTFSKGLLTSISLIYLLYGLVLLKVFAFFYWVVRYLLIKRINEDMLYPEVDKQYQIVQAEFSLLPLILVTLIVGIGLLYVGAPITFQLFTLFLILFIFISIAQIFRLKNLNFAENKSRLMPLSSVRIAKTSQARELVGEKILGGIFGIMKVTQNLSEFQKMGISILGVGQNFFPENAMIITNKRILFVLLSVTGGDKIVGSMNYAQMNFFFNREEIEKTGQKMLAKDSLKDFLNITNRKFN